MGEQVICIDDKPRKGCGPWIGDFLTKGTIYTITKRFISPFGTPAVYLYEAQSRAGYRADRFVPIKDESLEIFRKMDRKIFKRKKVSA